MTLLQCLQTLQHAQCVLESAGTVCIGLSYAIAFEFPFAQLIVSILIDEQIGPPSDPRKGTNVCKCKQLCDD